jgi:hypothetical protein
MHVAAASAAPLIPYDLFMTRTPLMLADQLL